MKMFNVAGWQDGIKNSSRMQDKKKSPFGTLSLEKMS